MANNPIKYSDLVVPDNSITELIKQLSLMEKSYVDALTKISKEAQDLVNSLKIVSGATEEGRKSTQKAATEADRLAKAQQQLTQAQGENAAKIAALNKARNEANNITKLTVRLNNSEEGSYDKLSAQYSLNKIRLNAMSKEQREATVSGRALEKQTAEIYEEMKKLQEATGKYSLNVGNYTESINAASASFEDRLKSMLGLNSEFGESLSSLGTGSQGATNGFTAMGNGAKAFGKTLLGLLANPVFLAIAGIAAVGASFKFWYNYNVGLVEATRLTKQFTDKSGADLKAYRNEIQATADTFGKDFKEVLTASNAVAKQFGISADESLQLIQDGFIAGADANSEYLDILKEYPAFFKEAGLSAEDFIAIVSETSTAGIFSDKGVDAIKEANLRLREMTPATAKAINGIGLVSSDIQKALANGTKTTFDIIQEVSEKLNELPENSAAVGTAIADIFGGPGEDAGLQYLKTLANISTNLDEVKAKTGLLGELQEEQLRSQAELSNALASLFDATGGTFEQLTTRAKTFVNDGLVSIIKGLISVGNYFIELYNESLIFKGLWQGIIGVVKTLFDVIRNALSLFVEEMKAMGTILKGVFTLDIDLIEKGLVDFAKAIPNQVKKAMKDVKENFDEGVENMQRKIKPIVIPVLTGEATASTAKNPILKNAKDSNAAKEAEKTTEDLVKLEKERQLKLLEQEKYGIQLRLAAAKKGSEEEKKLRLQLLDVETREQKVEAPEQAELIDLNAKDQAAGIVDEYIAAQMAMFDQQQQLAQSEFDLLRNSEEKKTQFRLQAEKDRLNKILELNKQAGTQLSDVEIDTIQNTISKIDQEISQSKTSDRTGDIYGLIGLNLDNDQKQAIDTSVAYAIDSLNEIFKARTAAADAAVAAADTEVEAAQSALDAEIDARNSGYASNVQAAQKNLELARQTQAKALADQAQAQKQQQQIETLQQIGSLVTASAKIWGQLGFPWAIPAIAVMFGSFALAKVKSAQLAKQAVSYGDGTVELLNDGGSHQSGRDIDLGTRADGTKRRAENGEFFAVINKRNSRRFRNYIPDVIKSFNNGTFAHKYLNAYDAQGLSIHVNNAPNLKELTDNVREIKNQNKRKYFVDSKGRTVETYKNLRRVVS